jgi:hypothetical protein
MAEPPSFGLGVVRPPPRAKAKKKTKKKKEKVLALGGGMAEPLPGQMGVAKSEK